MINKLLYVLAEVTNTHNKTIEFNIVYGEEQKFAFTPIQPESLTNDGGGDV